MPRVNVAPFGDPARLTGSGRESAVRSHVRGFEEDAAGDVDITDADALGATVSASRPVVDNYGIVDDLFDVVPALIEEFG
jgi:electron transfer flavoprotein alpha subunit